MITSQYLIVDSTELSAKCKTRLNLGISYDISKAKANNQGYGLARKGRVGTTVNNAI